MPLITLLKYPFKKAICKKKYFLNIIFLVLLKKGIENKDFGEKFCQKTKSEKAIKMAPKKKDKKSTPGI